MRYLKIPEPMYLMLAHELIHAVHMENGTVSAADPEGQAISKDNNSGHGITENDIRGEHKLPPRQGHRGQDTGN